MFLQSSTGERLELTFRDYEGPRFARPFPELNFMMVHARMKIRGHTWQETDPFLVDLAFPAIAGFFDGIANHHVLPGSRMTFDEPNLSFEFKAYLTHQARIRVVFQAELRPHWVKARRLNVDFLVSYKNLQHCAADLRHELQAFQADFPLELTDEE